MEITVQRFASYKELTIEQGTARIETGFLDSKEALTLAANLVGAAMHLTGDLFRDQEEFIEFVKANT